MTTQPPPPALTTAELQIGLRLWDAFNFEKDSYAHDLEAPEIWLLENHQALLAMARRLVELEATAYTTERGARQELWSFIRLHAGKSVLQAVSVEWLDAFAPELVSGRFADIWRPEGGESDG